MIVLVLALAAQAVAAGRVAARPWLPAPGGGRRLVPASTARSWRSRFTAGAAVLREQLMRLLPLVEPVGRVLVPARSPGGDCLAALEAVTAGLRDRFPVLAAVTVHEVAAHLSGGLWLAPAVPVLRFNTTLLSADAMAPS